MTKRIAEIRERCKKSLPTPQENVLFLLDQIHDRDITISRLQMELSRMQTKATKEAARNCNSKADRG